MKFIPYIHLKDYLPTIQHDQLVEQILDEVGDSERQFCEHWAIEKIRGKLDSYDLFFEIRSTLPYNFKSSYYAGDRVIIDYSDWISDKEYVAGEGVINNNSGYICLIDHKSEESFDESKWQGIGKKYEVYSIPLPYPRFSLEVCGNSGYYNVGDKIFWENHTYECIKETYILSHQELIQLDTYGDSPPQNLFPNSKAGLSQWKDLGEYKISDEIYPYYDYEGNPESPIIWELYDNRNPLLIQCVIDLSLFQLHKRISPNNIPNNRIEAMKMQFEWLNKVSEGLEDFDFYKNQSYGNDGGTISWGSNPKKQNGY